MWFRSLVIGGVASAASLGAARSTAQTEPEPEPPVALFDVACDLVAGRAASFPCRNVDLLAYLPLAALGGGEHFASDLWGFTDPETGREFVLLGLGSGTAFVEITSPTAPLFLGLLPPDAAPSPWRDVKVYARHAYIVSEAANHGLQVFDLGILLDIPAPPAELHAAAVYRGEGLGNAHNIAVNERTGFGYIVGSNTCGGGLHFVDLRQPKEPVFAGCFSDDLYTHDAQCVLYEGPDTAYRGREICFAYNEDTLTVVDVTEKAAPRQISRQTYQGAIYTHQGWTTEDHLFLLLGDEGDETTHGHGTRTRIWDIADLDRPTVIGVHDAATPAIDHNLYIRSGFAYQASYRAGLRIYDLSGVAEGGMDEVGFFDVYPADDAPEYNGAWSVYPFFPSGVVAVSGIEQGLFLLEPPP